MRKMDLNSETSPIIKFKPVESLKLTKSKNGPEFANEDYLQKIKSVKKTNSSWKTVKIDNEYQNKNENFN
jgi:hypothetical protein